MIERKLSRKPSVAASRKFSFVNVFDSSNDAPSNSATKSPRSKGKAKKPKVIWNGKDVTPRPIDPRFDDLSSMSCSFEDVGFLKAGTDDGTRLPDAAKGVLPWLESLADGASTPIGNDNGQAKTCQPSILGEATITVSRQEPQKIYKKGYLNTFDITLTETPTIELLNISGSYRSSDEPGKSKENENHAVNDDVTNQRQEKCTKVLRERAAQTFHNTTKNKACIAATPDTVDKGCDSSEIIEPTFSSITCNGSKGNIFDAFGHHDFVEPFTAAVVGSKGCLLDISEDRSPNAPVENSVETEATKLTDILTKWTKDKIFRSPELLDRLRLMERAVQQEINFEKQLKYCAIPIGSEAEIITKKTPNTCMSSISDDEISEEDSDGLEKLLTFRCHDGRPVLAICWHKHNHEVLAVGYGTKQALHRPIKEDGMIMLWSLRNEYFPEKIIRTRAVVLCLDFSKFRPSILAVGFSDGNVALYDTENATDRAGSSLICESAFHAGRHFSPVYQVKWVCVGQELERLVSIAGDGRILEWTIDKGMALTQLMALEREVSTNNSISRKVCGLSFDFQPENSNEYYAGAEDGSIYRCSCSYDDHHLGMYLAHKGPVKRVQFSPFVPDVFLTCSDDWTVKLWSISKEDKINQIAEMRSIDLTAAVNDIAWSKNISTIFCLVGADGRLEIWDIDKSILDPIVVQRENTENPGIQRTTVLFGARDPVIVVGTNQGIVEVFSTRILLPASIDASRPQACFREQVEKMNSIMRST